MTSRYKRLTSIMLSKRAVDLQVPFSVIPRRLAHPLPPSPCTRRVPCPQLANAAQAVGVRLMIDAEQTYFQEAIDNIVTDLQVQS